MGIYIYRNLIIYSNGWKGYNQANRIFLYYLTAKHIIRLLNYENNCFTDSFEGNWCAIKSKIDLRFIINDFVDIYLIKFMVKRK
ncbi:hypothetical protein H311_02091 [Anncaliia algerae PRA109]|nr:hypothetical protein H311_02091 [Anncaliia algerae PRA109]